MKKLALVTGANKGIGLETARQLAQRGVHVLVGARDLTKATGAAETLRAEGFEADPVALDVTSSGDIAAVAAMIGEKFGHLDILVNNAGIMVESDWSVNESATLPIAKIRETFDTNFFGVIELSGAVAAAGQERSGTDRQPFQHFGFVELARNAGVADPWDEVAGLQRVEDGTERLYGAFGTCAARHADQGK